MNKSTCVSPLVSFEVGAFSVDFLAAHKVTFVNLSPVETVRKVTQRGSGTRGRAGRREQQVVVMVVVVSSTNRRRRGSVLLFLFFLFVAGRGGAVSSVGAVETVGVTATGGRRCTTVQGWAG